MSQSVRTVQVILGSLILGLVVFGCIAAFVRIEPVGEELGRLLLLVLGLLAVSEVPAYFLVRRQFVARLRERPKAALDEARGGRVPPEMVSLAIIGAALAEGAGLFGAVICLVADEPLGLVATALAVFLIAAQAIGLGGIAEKVEGLVKETH